MQHMTYDGLTLDKQVTGESINISSWKTEQDYSAANLGGIVEKVLERASNENMNPGTSKMSVESPIVPINTLYYSESLAIVPLVGYSMSEAR